MSVAADTNDIGFVAVRVTPSSELQTPNSKLRTPNIAPGIYFRVQLGGITGHRDFAKDTGLLVTPAQAVAVAVAMVRVFSENGNRTDRKKARLKYLLDSWGQEKFLAETEKRLAFPLTYAALALCEQRRPVEKHAWLGARRQAQSGLNSLGIGVPVGRLSSRQMHALADLATHYGKGELRLTVWQNVIIPHLPDAFLETVRRNVQRLGFFTEASSAAGGIVACTGNQGCKYAAADTKGHAASLFKHLESRGAIGMPVTLHFTGCAHSCAQHYCGDLGFIAAKLSDGSEGYHIVIGGGMDHEQGTGRELFKGIRATELNPLVEKILLTYEAKKSSGETFVQWSRRHSLKDLQEILS